MMIPGIRSAVAGTFDEFNVSYLGLASSSSSATTYDFGTFTLNKPGILVVGVLGNGSTTRTISSVSMGGSAGTIYAQYDSTQWVPHGFAYRPLGGGAQNVSVTFSGAMSQAFVAAWLVTGSRQTAPSAGGNGAWGGGGVTSRSVSFNIPANGVAMYIHFHANNNSVTWSSATERADTAVGTVSRASAADKTVTAAISPHTETVTWSGSDGATVTGISWAP